MAFEWLISICYESRAQFEKLVIFFKIIYVTFISCIIYYKHKYFDSSKVCYANIVL